MRAPRLVNLMTAGHAPVKKVPTGDPLCEAILRKFSSMEECPRDWPDDWTLENPPQVRRESTIYRLSSARGRKSICVKVANAVSQQSQDPATLYAALQHYHARSDRERGFTVPEPFGWLPEYRAIIMEWVEGRTFSQILKRELFFRKKRHESIRKVAGWLRWFHQQSEVELGKLSDGKPLRKLIRIFEEPRELDKAATSDDPELRHHLETATRHSGALRGVEMDWAILHGDFKPTNLIISRSGNVVGIDFMGHRRGPVSHDICRFLSDLDFYRNLISRSYALSLGSANNDFTVFLSAYGGRAGKFDRPIFAYVYFITILSALVYQRRKFKTGPVHRLRLSVFRSIARQLSAELAGPAAIATSTAEREREC